MLEMHEDWEKSWVGAEAWGCVGRDVRGEGVKAEWGPPLHTGWCRDIVHVPRG